MGNNPCPPRYGFVPIRIRITYGVYWPEGPGQLSTSPMPQLGIFPSHHDCPFPIFPVFQTLLLRYKPRSNGVSVATASRLRVRYTRTGYLSPTPSTPTVSLPNAACIPSFVKDTNMSRRWEYIVLDLWCISLEPIQWHTHYSVLPYPNPVIRLVVTPPGTCTL